MSRRLGSGGFQSGLYKSAHVIFADMQYAYAYPPQSQHPCHAPSIMMVEHTPHPCVYPPGATMPQHTGQHPLCMELERVLCMILARAPYDPGCCRSAVELCKAYKARLKACCAGGYGGGGVEPGCAGQDTEISTDMEDVDRPNMEEYHVNSSTFLVGQRVETLRGGIGHVVEIVDWKGKRVYEVEFTDSKGRPYKLGFTKFFLRNA